jgi:hypothetical protein
MADIGKRHPTAEGPDSARSRYEARYRDALYRHHRHPSDEGLAEAYELGKQALSEGVPILDFVTIHMAARRGLFPDMASALADIDAFLRQSLGAFEHVQRDLDEARLRAAAEERRTRVLRYSEQLDVISAQLGASADLHHLLDWFVDEGCDVIGATSATVLLNDGGELRVVATGEPVRDGGEEVTTSVVTDVADSGVPRFDEATASAVLPLRIGSSVIGVLDLRFTPRPLDETKRAFLVEVATRLATAIDRSRGFERERLARMDAEAATTRFRAMRDIAAELSQATTRRAVAGVMLRAVMSASAATVGAVTTFRERGRRPDLLVSIPPGDSRKARAFSGAAHALDPLLDVGSSVELSSADEVRQVIGTQAADDLAIECLVAFPVASRRHVSGAVIVGWGDSRVLQALDRDLLTTQIVMGTPALERAARYDVEHDIAYTLQRGMLAIAEADMPETRWSAHYSTATTGLVGGDWYDVIDLTDDRAGFVIGDIVGRGVEAAVSMGHLRSAARALATCFDKPDEVLGAVDRFAATTGSGLYSSMAYVTINRRTGDLAYSVAGHPPPLVVEPDGSVVWLDGASSTLLGRGGPRSFAALTIPPGSVLVMYTDGVVERRGEQLGAGLDRLISAVRAEVADEDARNDARRLVARIGSTGRIDDDVAVLYVTFVGGRDGGGLPE